MSRLLWLLLLVPTCALTSSIFRPCKTSDYICIGSYLAANSECNRRVWDFIPERYTIARYAYDTPHNNSFYIDTDLVISNHNKCTVSKFHFNVLTNNAVVAITCPGLRFQSSRTLIQYSPEREDNVYKYNYTVVYPQVIMSVTLSPVYALSICTVPAAVHITALPLQKIETTDPETKKFLTTGLLHLNIYEREYFYHRANELIRYFINSMLCDFGCDF